MTQDVAEFIAQCSECLRHKPPPRHIRQTMEERPIPQRVWQRLHLDVWAAGGRSARGRNCVIAFVDSFSIYLVAIPARDHTAQTVINVFLKHVSAQFGVPAELVTDGAPEFRGNALTQFCAVYGITKHLVTPYHPQSNGHNLILDSEKVANNHC